MAEDLNDKVDTIGAYREWLAKQDADELAKIMAGDFNGYNNTQLGELSSKMKEGLKDNPEAVNFAPIAKIYAEFARRGKKATQFWVGLQADWPIAPRFRAAYKAARQLYPDDLPRLIGWAGSKRDSRSAGHVSQLEKDTKPNMPIYK